MTTYYRYDDWGWYVGTVDFHQERSTPVAPANLSLEPTEGSNRSNWNGSGWVNLPYVTPPTEAQEVLNQIAYVKAIFETKVVEDRFQPITYLGNVYETTQQKREEIISLLAIGILPEGFYWFDINDTPTVLTLEQLRILAATVASRDLAIYQKLATKNAALDACTTLEQVAAISWED